LSNSDYKPTILPEEVALDFQIAFDDTQMAAGAAQWTAYIPNWDGRAPLDLRLVQMASAITTCWNGKTNDQQSLARFRL
jgi:hypothetical protein